MNPKQANMLTLQTMPEDMRLFTVSKVGTTSPIDYFNTIITSKSLNFSFDNYFVAKDLKLSPLVKKPALATRYKTLMDSCLKANNVDAHFVKEDNTVCSNCLHFFLLTKFFVMMLGLN
uniref:Uncharacterized protein n=1 Tax=Brassica oleracea TaxID=3712 RepID=A0A3P6DVQ3_BRAOL|nr:unnamed protein product [Brassica oleracea]